MKPLDEEVLEILSQAFGGLPVRRITETLRLKHRGEKYGIKKISDILCKLERKGLVSRKKTKYNITAWTPTKATR